MKLINQIGQWLARRAGVAQRREYAAGFITTAGRLLYILEHDGPDHCNASIDVLEADTLWRKRGEFEVGEANAIASIRHIMRLMR